MKNVVIVGASLAGVNAVEGLRERGYTGDITLVGAESALPYDRPPLSKEALLGEVPFDELELRPRQWYDDLGVTLRLGTRAERLDAGRRTLRLAGGEELGYDRLMIATGSAPVPLAPPLCEDRACFSLLRTADDARRLREHLVPGRHLVILGAGFIGLEVASTARALGVDVTIIDIAATPLARVLGTDFGPWFTDLHEAEGVRVRCGTCIDRIEPGPSGGVRLVGRGGDVTAADHLLVSIGARPVTDWLSGSGLDTSDGVLCAPDLSAGPDIVAAGDVARWPNAFFAETMRVEHWTNAVEQGRHAAGTLLGERDPFTAIPYFWTNQYGAKIRFVGRAAEGDQVAVDADGRSVVALFGRDGVVRGALCANAPRRLARCRAAIGDRVAWPDAVSELTERASA